MRNNVESHSLRERAALTDCYDVTVLHLERWAAVRGNVLVTFLETTVLGDVVEVVSPDNDGSLHLRTYDNAFQDTTADGYVTGERAFLVNVVTFESCVWCFDTETDISCESDRFLLLVTNSALPRNEHRLL